MRVLIGFDHRGHEAAGHLGDRLRTQGHEASAFGPPPGESCDYPEIAAQVGRTVAAGEADFGVLIDASGVGMAIAANKVVGVRAASVHDEITAELSKAHTNANVICLSADLLGHRLMEKIVELYLQTTFEGGRHQRRIDKIAEIERGGGD